MDNVSAMLAWEMHRAEDPKGDPASAPTRTWYTMMRTLRLLARMATASVGGYWAQGLHAIADTACKT